MENSNFLKRKYNLHNSEEVKTAAKRTEEASGEKVPQNLDAQIQNYLDRLEKLVLDPKKDQKKRTLDFQRQCKEKYIFEICLKNN